jgi:hypothetical protein
MEIVLMVMIVVLALASPLWGADTRDGRDWQPRSDWQERQGSHGGVLTLDGRPFAIYRDPT